MLVVAVEFIIKPGFVHLFQDLVRQQAENSLASEPACHRFDVCQDSERDNVFFLYEIYTDPDAFADHLASAHFLAFDAAVAGWVESKSVRKLKLLS